MTVLKIVIYKKDSTFVYAKKDVHDKFVADYFINGTYRGRSGPMFDMNKFINVFIKE